MPFTKENNIGWRGGGQLNIIYPAATIIIVEIAAAIEGLGESSNN